MDVDAGRTGRGTETTVDVDTGHDEQLTRGRTRMGTVADLLTRGKTSVGHDEQLKFEGRNNSDEQCMT